jgi:hypothetical protein
MSYSLIKFIKRSKNRNKERILFILLFIGGFVACQGALEDGTPFGPSTSIFKVLPKTSIVATGENITLIPYGGTAPISWTSADTTIGTIVVNTGVFTAGTTQGTTTVNALDAVGNLATASITIPGLALTFAPNGTTQIAAAADDIITVTANGSGAGFTATVTNDNAGTAYLLVPTFSATTGETFTITAPATLPTLAEGNQTFSIKVTDPGNTNKATFTYVFQKDVV